MKLIRNTTETGVCKYALIRLDKIQEQLPEGQNVTPPRILAAPEDLVGYIEFGLPKEEDEFFVIKLKDINAYAALKAYAANAALTDPELGKEVDELANRAGVNNPYVKIRD